MASARALGIHGLCGVVYVVAVAISLRGKKIAEHTILKNEANKPEIIRSLEKLLHFRNVFNINNVSYFYGNCICLNVIESINQITKSLHCLFMYAAGSGNYKYVYFVIYRCVRSRLPVETTFQQNPLNAVTIK